MMVTAHYQALAAVLRPTWLQFGIGCTAALRSTTLKKGDHRAHLCVHSASTATTVSVVLQKGLRSRQEEGELVSELLLMAMLEAKGVSGNDTHFRPALAPGETLQRASVSHLSPALEWIIILWL